jgi:hypothetical protein
MFQALDLNDHAVLDNQIEPIAAVQFDALVLNGKR